MKTTLNLDAALMRDAKKRAVEEGTTLTQIVERALRDAMNDEPDAEPYVFEFPTVSGGELIVDPADRDALYELLDRSD